MASTSTGFEKLIAAFFTEELLNISNYDMYVFTAIYTDFDREMTLILNIKLPYVRPIFKMLSSYILKYRFFCCVMKTFFNSASSRHQGE